MNNKPAKPKLEDNSKSPPPLRPGSTIGILGGGQLGRMTAMAAADMGYHVHVFCPEEDAPAIEVAKSVTNASYRNENAMARFASGVDVVTYEFENIPLGPVEELAKLVPVRPSPHVLKISQHRVLEKEALNAMGVATAPFRPVNSAQELVAATNALGLPSVLKTAQMGYDGKGQIMIDATRHVPSVWPELKCDEAILEGFVRFRMEISVIVARDILGNVECYCPVQNKHEHHILAETIAPAPISDALAAKAEDIARRIAVGLDLVGLIAVEMFVTRDDEILVNELAPRPHNSGHWTMDACITSQFQQVVRAVCGLPLGSPEYLRKARMINLIGDDVLNWQNHTTDPNAKLHLYGKKEVRPGRKMGHVTFLQENNE
jgi:5-(carboxyamino)imidazole ribonucleotide synthase